MIKPRSGLFQVQHFYSRLAVRPVAALTATLVVAFIGGLLAALAGLPVAWLTGAMTVCAVMAAAGAPVRIPESWRLPVFVVLGISMGSGVTPEALALARTWPLSLLALAVAVPVMVAASVPVISRMPGWDRRTAMLAAMPGALSYVISVAVETGVDARRVAVVQALRLVVLVLVLPSVIIATGGAGPASLPPVADMNWVDMGLLALVCAIAAILFPRFRIPGGMLFGPMFVSAIAHGAGWTAVRAPPEILNPAMLVLGANIGARFTGIGWPFIRSVLAVGLLNLAIASIVAVIFAALVAVGLAIPFGQALLAFAPGGAEAMALLAFALDLDPAYVAVHHVARFLGLGLFLPLVLRVVGTGAKRSSP
ncbi:MAG: AbrB family transcriptional regulator [Rhodobiaceae bacterium]|nr:AbrB family transcriptional regulator [Rhodobiaceae bacterium]MCC0014088.1 AbrB family transcriptional regulator [Rhodobiaceae bacterium]MCC0051678.1 AbrB family transcriptional regulator [Rhodobiaceae bacterium]MCC0061986.1 AbrB family transcriptional regulator [Rhodobiaceae bacterium]